MIEINGLPLPYLSEHQNFKTTNMRLGKWVDHDMYLINFSDFDLLYSSVEALDLSDELSQKTCWK